MKLKRFGMALVVVLASGAVMASSAFANHRATTTKRTLRTGATAGTTTVLAGRQPITAALAGGPLVLETEVGTTPLKLSASGLECTSCGIFNEAGGGKGSGGLRLTGVTVTKPTNCRVAASSIRVEEVTTDFTYVAEEFSLALFEPVSGTTLGTVKIENGTGSCPVAGSYPLAGELFVVMGNSNGVYATSQPFYSSAQINEEAGGALRFGSKPASLTAAAKFEAGGLYFGVE